jgi:hypothetical protein
VLVMKGLKLAVAGIVLLLLAFLGVRALVSGDGAGETASAARTAAHPGGAGARPSSSGQPLREAGLGAIQDDDPVGSLRLEGQVIDEEEAPVAGARVAIDSRPPRVVETDRDGSFAFDRLIGRTYRLEASAGGGYAGPAQLRLREDTEPVILRLRSATAIEVEVRDPDGGPVADAEVELRSTLTWQGRTNATGIALLEGVGMGWMHVLRVEAEGYAPHVQRVPVDRTANERRRLVVTLVRGSRVEGIVVDDGGRPVAGARVLSVSMSEPYPITDVRRDAVTTDDQGQFALSALASGTYRFVASHPDHAHTSTSPIHVGERGTRSVRIELVPGGIVEGIVRDAKGTLVPTAHVRAVAAGGLWRYARETFTGEDGRFRMTGLPRRAMDVMAAHERGSSALVRADLTARSEAKVALTLDVTGVLAGVVVGPGGEPVAEAQVLASPGRFGDRDAGADWEARGGAPTGIADAGGRFRFDGLPEGTYHVRAVAPVAPPDLLWSSRGIEARTGQEDLRIVLPADGKVRGKVLFADGSAPELFLVAVDALPAIPFSSRDGTFTIPSPGGIHDLIVTGLAFEREVVANVEIEGDKDVGTITVKPGRSISGRVVGPEGHPVADARVVAGHLLAGGGTELNIPEEGVMVKETRTDGQGRYVLRGLAEHSITLLAEAAGIGRSRSVTVPRGASSAEVNLFLEVAGALEGRVTLDGKPLAETVVIANPVGATSSNFFVLTGPDGTFAFDRLAPDQYVAYPIVNGDIFLRLVTIGAGERARLDFEATRGEVTLQVTLKTTAGRPVPAAEVMFLGVPEVSMTSMESPRDGSFLLEQPRTDAPVAFFRRKKLDGAPAIFEGLSAGRFTVCAIPLPIDPDDPESLRRIMEAGIDKLPMTCAAVSIAARPAKQSTELRIPDDHVRRDQ